MFIIVILFAIVGGVVVFITTQTQSDEIEIELTEEIPLPFNMDSSKKIGTLVQLIADGPPCHSITDTYDIPKINSALHTESDSHPQLDTNNSTALGEGNDVPRTQASDLQR